MLLIYGLLCALTTGAQTIASQADSLLRRLHITASYEDRIDLLGKLSDIFSYTDTAKAIDYAMQIKKLASEKNDERAIGIAHYRLGGVYLELNNFDKAVENYEKAEKILTKDTSRIARKYWDAPGLIME